MFDIGWSELLVIAVVTVVFIGPRELPKMLMTIGRWTAKARSIAREFQTNLEDMAREAEMDEVKESLQSAANIDLGVNPHNILDPTGKPADISGVAPGSPSITPAYVPPAPDLSSAVGAVANLVAPTSAVVAEPKPTDVAVSPSTTRSKQVGT
ncbi:MAG: twin-arginine translocase subunit TatB [Alphaproteobacteria bacterium]|nr:twin-arginine translocase subunit TatB [Alphaproteobacteria bacterium]